MALAAIAATVLIAGCDKAGTDGSNTESGKFKTEKITIVLDLSLIHILRTELFLFAEIWICAPIL